jgi:hypothetical protein
VTAESGVERERVSVYINVDGCAQSHASVGWCTAKGRVYKGNNCTGLIRAGIRGVVQAQHANNHSKEYTEQHRRMVGEGGGLLFLIFQK